MSMTTTELQRLHPQTLDELQGLTTALEAVGWQRVAPGDIAALRTAGIYPDYELANFRTARLERAGATTLNCGLAVWRRLRSRPRPTISLADIQPAPDVRLAAPAPKRDEDVPPIYDALTAASQSTRALAEEALDEAGDQAASRR